MNATMGNLQDSDLTYEINGGMVDKTRKLLYDWKYVNPNEVEYKINADFVRCFAEIECYREMKVSYLWILPLLEKAVRIEEADYILYMHPYARCDDATDLVVSQLKKIAKMRKEGAQIIVIGKAANAEKHLNGSIDNIIFWGDHFIEKLGKKFGFDIKEHYFVYDDEREHLSVWPVDGCLNKCKFCRRTYMDIKFESISLDVIKKNFDAIKAIAPEKLKTVSLRAENLTEYGIDIYGEQRLHELIDLVDSYVEIENIRLDIGMSIGEITPEILDSICRSKKIRYICMSLEAGTNRLLKLIGKKHTRERAIEVFQRIRAANPTIELASVVMIGLPTEELEDMWELADLVIQTKPDILMCNHYISSPRHPLVSFPQTSEFLKDYHLQVFLKTLRRYGETHKTIPQWKVRLQYRKIYKNKSSRRVIKTNMRFDSENELFGIRDYEWVHKTILFY